MKSTWVVNGKIQLVITPSSDIEKSLLDQLSQGPVEIYKFEKLQVGTESVVDCVVITPKVTVEAKVTVG